MKVIHVLRKPCSESTVAANVLRWGTGAINVDATRVSVSDADSEAMERVNSPNSGRFVRAPFQMRAPFQRNARGFCQVVGTGLFDTRKGRWPANLVLQHLDGCRCEGTKEIRVVGCTAKTQHLNQGLFFYGSEQSPTVNYATKGRETVAAWSCEPGCPVAALDEQSGFLHARGNQTPTKRGSGGIFWNGSGHGVDLVDSGDSGGASRFFKQFGGSPTTATPRPPTPDDPVPSGGRRGDG